MRSAEFLQACLDAGMPLEMATKALKAFDQQVPHIVELALEPVRAKARARQAESRSRKSRHVTDVTSGHVTLRDIRDEPRAHVGDITTNLGSSLDISEANASSNIRSIAISKPNGFARFWEAYPRKVGKGKAEAAYAKALKRIHGPDPPAELLAALERVKRLTWPTLESQFIPHASTWLNERRWEDEPETPDERDHNHPGRPTPHGNGPRADANFAGAALALERRRGASPGHGRDADQGGPPGPL